MLPSVCWENSVSFKWSHRVCGCLVSHSLCRISQGRPVLAVHTWKCPLFLAPQLEAVPSWLWNVGAVCFSSGSRPWQRRQRQKRNWRLVFIFHYVWLVGNSPWFRDLSPRIAKDVCLCLQSLYLLQSCPPSTFRGLSAWHFIDSSSVIQSFFPSC